MKAAKLDVIRFNREDVIATSGAAVRPRFTISGFQDDVACNGTISGNGMSYTVKSTTSASGLANQVKSIVNSDFDLTGDTSVFGTTSFPAYKNLVANDKKGSVTNGALDGEYFWDEATHHFIPVQ